MHLSPRLVLLLILPPLLWAANAVFARLAISSIGPLWLNALRWGLAFLILLVLGWRALATPTARAQVAERWGYLGILGLIGIGAYNGLQYVALRTSTPVNVTLIAASLPLWSMIIGTLFYRVHPTRPQLLGAMLSLAGVLTVLSRGDADVLLRIQLVEGDLLMVLAIVGWAVYSWMLARPPAHMSGAARPDWNWAEFLLAQCLFGVVIGFAAAGIGEAVAPSMTPDWNWRLLATIVFIAVGPSVIAYRSWGLAVAEAGPAMAAIFYNLTPLIAAVLSVLVIGEWPQAYHGLAFLLIVAGIFVASRRS
ncbi:MAG: DMT family transporter [Sulfuritalea sp.]|nr:DMT family transporter [Sulfuritalea sp.]